MCIFKTNFLGTEYVRPTYLLKGRIGLMFINFQFYQGENVHLSRKNKHHILQGLSSNLPTYLPSYTIKIHTRKLGFWTQFCFLNRTKIHIPTSINVKLQILIL